MRFLILTLLLTPAAFAHPLDDKAQMASEVVIVSDSRLEFVLDFRYVDAVASLSEVNGTPASPGLDANGDGTISKGELETRFDRLVLELAFAFGITVDGAPIAMTADYDRFKFASMDQSGPLDIEAGVAVDWLRIHYRFVFTWDAPAPLAAGDHTVEYFFNSQQSVVHTPSEQMIAFDARVEPRVRITDIIHETVGLPRMRFSWHVKAPDKPPDPPSANQPESVPATPPDPEQAEPPSENVPAWFTLVAGVALAIGGLATTIRRAIKKRKGVLAGALVVLAGLAIALVALVWLGYVAI